MSHYKLCPDAIIHFRDGKCLLSNPRSRTHIVIKGAVPELLGEGDLSYWETLFETCDVQDATQDYYGKYGLHGDHTGVKYSNENSVEKIPLLLKRWILVESSMDAYNDYFRPLDSILDQSHLGRFHQRVGQYLTIDKRLRHNRWKWWHDQKYTEDGRDVLDGPYRYIAKVFLEKTFSKEKVQGLKILDFGCGNGFYSNVLKQQGAEVVGLDTSKNLIDLARENFGDIDFVHVENEEEGLQFLTANAEAYDMIFMHDVLLLLLQPEDEKELVKLNQLLACFGSALKEGGRLCALEPNGTFFLSGRYGNPKNPYAIVTEYQDAVFNIAPILPTVIEKMSGAGFALSHYEHPKHSKTDDSDAPFVNEFCIWDYMEFSVLKK